MKKLVIYLDQNFISDIAKYKSGINKNVKPELVEIFDIIKKGVREEKFIVPDSISIKTETAAALEPRLVKEIRSHLKYLGQVSLVHHWDIQDSQFESSLLEYLKKKPTKKQEWEPAFHDNPDKRMVNFTIDVNFPHMKYESNRVESLQQARDKGIKYKSQYKEEMKANREYYKKRLKTHYRYYLHNQSIDISEAEKFIDSNNFSEIPNIDIFTRLWSKDLSKKGRKGKESDFTDIDTISAYMPYCNIMTTDNYMATNLRELSLDKKYNCNVFTMKDNDLAKMKKLLLHELKSRPPANESIFSIVCYLAEGEQTFSTKFVSLLSSAVNDFHRRIYQFDKEVYISVLFIKNHDYSAEKELSDSIVIENGKAGIKLNNALRADMVIYMNHFETLVKSPNESIEQIIAKMLDFEKGKATVLIPSNFKAINFEKSKDVDLLDDIADAIKKKKIITSKYKLNIIYNKICLIENVYIVLQNWTNKIRRKIMCYLGLGT
ncbi:hypothetical protein K8R32_03165 [bacterium]|nr:hypothetical protein [bacterium]